MAFNAKFFVGLVLFFGLGFTSSAAPSHSVTLTFTKSATDTGVSGTGYIVWRKSSTCPIGITDRTGFTALNTKLITTNTYTDSTVIPSQYCYLVTFLGPGSGSLQESVISNAVGVAVLPQAPSNVKVGTIN